MPHLVSGSPGSPASALCLYRELRAEYGLVDINPRLAERLILATFTDGQIYDIGDEVKGSRYMLLLGTLVKQAEFSDSELGEFLAEARNLADEWLNRAGPRAVSSRFAAAGSGRVSF